MDIGDEYDSLYLDFSETFDGVPYERLRKVEGHGIGEEGRGYVLR